MNISAATIQELDQYKATLSQSVNCLVKTKKHLYSNIDIESPMSEDEKKLNKQISALHSEINAIIIEKRERAKLIAKA